MSNYWKNHYDANAERFPVSPLKQVDRTINGAEEQSAQIEAGIESLKRILDLDKSDRVVDLCCGNGVMTQIVASSVATIVGVDFSVKLIEYADLHSTASNLRYVVEDVVKLSSSFFSSTNKVYMLGGVQYLNDDELLTLLQAIEGAPSVESIFISAVPDAQRLSAYYDDERKMAYYLEREAAGKPHMGTWWSQAQIQTLAARAGWRAIFSAQPSEFVSAYYRYDCLLKRADA